MIPKLFQTWFRVPELVDADWESLRSTLLRRSLALLLPLIAVYALFTALLGHPVLPAVAGLGFAGLTTVWRQCVLAEVFACHLGHLSEHHVRRTACGPRHDQSDRS